MSDYPRLAVGVEGTIHVVWVRAALFGGGLAQGIYYAHSRDGGETWSEPLEVAEGAFAWPQVTVSGVGQVHLLWNEVTGEHAWWHRWSTDGGEGWTRPERVPGFGSVPGPARLIGDGSETVHLVGLGHDANEEPALLYTTWDGQRWGQREMFHLDLDTSEASAGVSAALLPALGQFDIVFRGETQQEGEIKRADLWHSERTVPVILITPAPTATPHPTATPAPTPVPTTPPTPTPSFGSAPPSTADGSLPIPVPLILAGGLAALVVAGVLGGRLLRAGRR